MSFCIFFVVCQTTDIRIKVEEAGVCDFIFVPWGLMESNDWFDRQAAPVETSEEPERAPPSPTLKGLLQSMEEDEALGEVENGAQLDFFFEVCQCKTSPHLAASETVGFWWSKGWSFSREFILPRRVLSSQGTLDSCLPTTPTVSYSIIWCCSPHNSHVRGVVWYDCFFSKNNMQQKWILFWKENIYHISFAKNEVLFQQFLSNIKSFGKIRRRQKSSPSCRA